MNFESGRTINLMKITDMPIVMLHHVVAHMNSSDHVACQSPASHSRCSVMAKFYTSVRQQKKSQRRRKHVQHDTCFSSCTSGKSHHGNHRCMRMGPD